MFLALVVMFFIFQNFTECSKVEKRTNQKLTKVICKAEEGYTRINKCELKPLNRHRTEFNLNMDTLTDINNALVNIYFFCNKN